MTKMRSKDLRPLSLEEAFKLFSKGLSGYGPFWDHVLGYWKASMECPQRIFFLRYEELKKETLINVRRLAEFLGQPFSMEEERERVMEEIIELCSFKRLSNLEVNKNGTINAFTKNDIFFRKELTQPPIADAEKLPSPRLFAAHIPYTSLPKSILCYGCKIVYVCRNSKDVLISLWHHMAKMRSKDLPPLSLEEAFKLFSKGLSWYGPFWDHVLGYWNASLECPQRFFFLRYEELKKETSINVRRLAEFLGQPFSVEEERERVVEEITELCSFGRLSNLEVNKNGSRNAINKNDMFFRKGEVGDWSNHLAENLDQITNEKLHGIF
ncbi:hypothetical protein RHMOL_Rhmol04G0108100 [Rhododendron molle]|uniref:Uncharacterized protein n=1 Tax=Rhododendron molle TaxID=49168 RepID=A0ACC0P070_RHOML|nr:hypothetical protein RHMOL_Rhmol04G0108100 [Rhododendron molle]